MTKTVRKTSRGFIHVLLVLLSIVCLFPFVWMIRSSLMNTSEIFLIPIRWVPEKILLSNYKEALTAEPFALYFRNSLFIVVMNIVGNIFSSSFAAFGFSRIKFKGRDLIFALVIATMMIPGAVVLIPQFIGWKLLGAYDTYFPLVLPSFFINAFFIFLLKQFYYGIPVEYDEAAFIDGAGYFKIYSSIILPLSRPALTTVGVFTFMWTWNDFFGPLIYLNSSSKYTVALGLQAFIGQYITQWNLMMAASAVVVIPMIILFFFAQRAFIEGISFAGLKG